MPAETHRRVITLGEAMLQVTPSPIGPLAQATAASLAVAGAESTVASYLAMLGHHAIWLSAVGDDPIGERIVSEIRSAGVYTAHVQRDGFAPSGVYFKDPTSGGSTAVHYYRSGSAASRMGPDTFADFRYLRHDLVHLSGITPALSATCARLVESVIREAHAAHARVSFDVNFRPGLWRAEDAAGTLAELANQADIVFVGLDEAHVLWSTATPDDVRDVLARPEILIVKDSSIGATAFQASSSSFEPALPVEVVEPVGAGDAFAAGVLHGMLTEQDIFACLRFGHLLASSSLSSPGDLGPLPAELAANAERTVRDF
ncbi:hypothetical protein ASF88_19395 [Leifsonia sp. Leaf336]|uniref:sugar kinase n=1 Tax=Leifsonia sp. Leaf336 TaxID=1736341 RepID=UPI0007008C32|nr:sugar kinase [Leifsonia sp. Leaf336]KQR51328.1 hypothetical protein ASF88_19395 [Leifsonia sp. Leaf336]